jgi:cytoskeletal protein CcmA (bactofilin family)
MFSRDRQKALDTMPADLPAKMVDIPAPKPRTSKTSMPSIVSEGLHIAGNLFSDGDVQVDGRVEGDVQGRNITVGATGTVVGKIIADEAMISGAVNGEIRARAVVLTRTAKVASDITQESVSIESGAVFEGAIRRPGSGGTAKAGANGGAHKGSELLLTTPAEKSVKL